MKEATASFEPLADSLKHLARRLFTIVENRLQLLMVEMQEERERLLRAILLAFGAIAFGFLAGIALTGAIAEWQTMADEVRGLAGRADGSGGLLASQVRGR